MPTAFFAAVVAAGGAALRFLGRRASPSPQTSSISDIHVGIAGDAGAGLLLLLPSAPSTAMDMQVAEIEPAVEASRESKAEEEALEVVQYVGEHDEEAPEVEQYVGEHDEEALEVEHYVGEHDEEALEVEQYVGEHDEEALEVERLEVEQYVGDHDEEALEVAHYVGEHDEERLEVEHYVGEHDEERLEVEHYVGEHDEERLEVEHYVGEHDEEAVEVEHYVGEHDEERLEVEQYVGEHDEEALEVEQYVGEHDEEALEVEQYVGEHDEEGGEPEPIPAMKDSSIAVNQPRYEADHLILMPVDMDSEYPALKCSEKDSSTAMNQSRHEVDDSILMPIDMGSEYPVLKCSEKDSSTAVSQARYEVEDLTSMPDHCDPARENDYEFPIIVSPNTKIENEEELPSSVEEVPTMTDTGKKSKVVRKGLEKRRELIAAWKSSTLVEKQKRAEEVRAYKADLQNQKKEQEEEELRRLEALKREREKRNAARISPLTPKQRRASLSPTISSTSPNLSTRTSSLTPEPSLPRKISPNWYKGLKINDPESGSSSPLPKLPTRISSIGFVESSRANDTSNGLSPSISSLAELKKEAIHSESKADLSGIKKLAEPKGSNMHHAASVKPSRSASSSKASGIKNSATASSMQARKTDDSHVDDSPVLDPEKTVVMVESVDVLAPPSTIVAQVSESELNVHLNPLYFLAEPGDF